MRKLAIALCLAACGPDSGSGSIALGDLGEAVIGAYCDIYVRCGIVEDRQACLDLFGRDINVDQDLLAAVAAGKVIYHGDLARTCIDGVTGNGTCDRSMVFSNRNQPAACDLTFQGTVAAGGGCAIDEECISQQCDVPSCPDACCQGTCIGDAAPVRPKVGQPCGDTTPTCEQSYCDTTTLLCTAYVADGGTCMSSGDCQSGSCNLTAHTCQSLVATGGACMGATQCKLIGDSCPTATMVCTPVAGTGASCGTSNDCHADLSCDASKHCAARPTVGQSCAGSQTCVGGYCDATTTTCTAYKPEGAPCMLSSECQNRSCDATSHTCLTDPVCI